MDGQISGTNEALENKEEVDPWIAAFAALEQKGEEPAEEPPAAGGDSGIGSGADAQEAGEPADGVEGGNGAQDEGAAGGLGAPAGIDRVENEGGIASLFGEPGIDIEQYRTDTTERVRDKAITDIAQEFIKRGYKHSNGALGVTINDPEICKRDDGGVPHYYNPDTGMEFRGDNPRRQATEWCEDYNNELARMFNNACAEYEAHLMKQEAPKLAVMEFRPKYEKLDPIRQGMFDNIIQDFEIRENGELIGYSCNLDKALASVDRQVAMIQQYAKAHQPAAPAAPEPKGPAVDMPTSGGGQQQQETPRSLEEAMLRIQEQKLAELNK